MAPRRSSKRRAQPNPPRPLASKRPNPLRCPRRLPRVSNRRRWRRARCPFKHRNPAGPRRPWCRLPPSSAPRATRTPRSSKSSKARRSKRSTKTICSRSPPICWSRFRRAAVCRPARTSRQLLRNVRRPGTSKISRALPLRSARTNARFRSRLPHRSRGRRQRQRRRWGRRPLRTSTSCSKPTSPCPLAALTIWCLRSTRSNSHSPRVRRLPRLVPPSSSSVRRSSSRKRLVPSWSSIVRSPRRPLRRRPTNSKPRFLHNSRRARITKR